MAEPIKPAEPKLPVEPRPPEKPETPEKKELREKLSAVLKQYGGKESDIPTNHEYWQWANQYRSQ